MLVLPVTVGVSLAHLVKVVFPRVSIVKILSFPLIFCEKGLREGRQLLGGVAERGVERDAGSLQR